MADKFEKDIQKSIMGALEPVYDTGLLRSPREEELKMQTAAIIKQRDIELQKVLASMVGSQIGAHTHSAAQHTQTPQVASTADRTQMILMRLRLGAVPWKNFATFLEGETVYVVIVLPAGPTMLEDGAAMFPSDTLITQLRLLL